MPTPQHYAAHEVYDFVWKGEVLCIRFVGVFNIESVDVFFADLKQTVAERGLTR